MGIYYWQKKTMPQKFNIFEKYILLAQQNEDKENEHIGLHQLAMIYRDQVIFIRL